MICWKELLQKRACVGILRTSANRKIVVTSQQCVSSKTCPPCHFSWTAFTVLRTEMISEMDCLVRWTFQRDETFNETKENLPRVRLPKTEKNKIVYQNLYLDHVTHLSAVKVISVSGFDKLGAASNDTQIWMSRPFYKLRTASNNSWKYHVAMVTVSTICIH